MATNPIPLLSKKNQLIKKAFYVAKNAHKNQKRLSGEDFITHPVSVASIIFSWIGENPHLIAAALLHDVTEDTEASLEQIEKKFGKDVAKLVDGVSKLKSAKNRTSALKNIQKVIRIGYLDPRVFVLKLADRLHNMQTLYAMPKNKQLQKAKETEEVYVRLAESLGMWEVKKELEDLAFMYTNPIEFKKIKNEIQNDPRVQKLSKTLITTIKRTIPKNINFYIYSTVNGAAEVQAKKNKNLEMGLTFSNDIFYVNDIVSIRILTSSIENCYRILGIIENKFKASIDEERFNNYLLKVRANGYSALQTTLNTTYGAIEIAITTNEREDFNRRGILTLLKNGHTKNLSSYSMKIIFSQMGKVLYMPKGAKVIDLIFLYPNLFKHSNKILFNGKLFKYFQEIPNGAIYKTFFTKHSSKIDFEKALANCLPATIPHIQKARRIVVKNSLRQKGSKIIHSLLSRRGVMKLNDINEIAEKILYDTKTETVDKLYLGLGTGTISANEISEFLDMIGFTKSKNMLTSINLTGSNKSGILAYVTNEIAALGGDIRSINQIMKSVKSFQVRILVHGLTQSDETKLKIKLQKSNLFTDILLV